MKILAIDTSTKYFSAAVAEDGKVLSSVNIKMEKTLSSSIVPQLEKLLKKTVRSISRIDGFAVGLGPGSFTSLRVGLSTVKAFALVLNKPVVGIPSLDVVAMGSKVKEGRIGVLSDARRGLVYAAFYERSANELKRVSEYLLVPVEKVMSEIRKTDILTGDALETYAEVIRKDLGKSHLKIESEKNGRPNARHLIPLALKQFSSGKTDNPDALVPMYLYPEDCQVVPKK